jgi:hypothetical protein
VVTTTKPALVAGVVLIALVVVISTIAFGSAISLALGSRSSTRLSSTSSASATITTSSTAVTDNETVTKFTNSSIWYHLFSGQGGALCTTNESAIISKLKIAVVRPVFTATAYQYDGFYTAYSVLGNPHSTIQEKSAALADFHVPLVNGWAFSGAMANFLVSREAKQCGINLGGNTQILTDVDVSNGALFYPNGSARFGVVTLVFDEYDTQAEYNAYYRFVAGGGHLILMDACNFLAEVSYNATSNYLTFVKGHGWQFNGTAAWAGPPERWMANNTNWVGSYFCCFKLLQYNGALVSNDTNFISAGLRNQFPNQVVFQDYASHEENDLSNMTGTSIISTFRQNGSSSYVVASYIHHYKMGTVVHIGFMSDDVFGTDVAAQDFYILSLVYFATV